MKSIEVIQKIRLMQAMLKELTESPVLYSQESAVIAQVLHRALGRAIGILGSERLKEIDSISA